ncbi:MAG: tetratricopeptide repeat protein [Spirochaetaceae bacterium]|jgi:tetratricopeptide (TPR) repeat protein|nr:tetratricopeptide repeat protein [Spirochaetaceae bacterium]
MAEDMDSALVGFFSKNRKPILVCAGAIVLALAVFLIVSIVADLRISAAIERLDETFVPRYEKLSAVSAGTAAAGGGAEDAASDGDAIAEAGDAGGADSADALVKDLVEFAASCSGYPSARAWSMAGALYFERSAWKEAEEAYLQSAQKGGKTYLAPVSSYNAAVCAEEGGDLEGAIEHYERVLSHQDFPQAAHAQFSIGRLYEALEKTDLAKQAYQNIVDKRSDYTGWTELATDRLIVIEAAGAGD